MHHAFVPKLESLTFVLEKLCSCRWSYTVISTLKRVLFTGILIYVCSSTIWWLMHHSNYSFL